MPVWFNFIQVLTVIAVSTCMQSSVASSPADINVLNYALLLEHLEYAFYRDGVALLEPNSEGGRLRQTRYVRLLTIRDHEKAHVDTLTTVITALGGTPVRECEYDFGYKTGSDFLKIARILENIGVTAYLGAAYQIGDNPNLLTAAASIATVEARHASYLNAVHKLNPFPAAFDSPLDMRAVVGLASGFIKSCPDAIPITPYPLLTVSHYLVHFGDSIRLTGDFTQTLPPTGVNCVFYSGSTSTTSSLTTNPGNSNVRCVVPSSALGGDIFLFVTTADAYSPRNSDGILAGPALLYLQVVPQKDYPTPP